MIAQVEALKQKDPTGYVKKNATKRLAAIARLAFEVIPQDPTRPEYRQGHTLGDEHKHWFRAKIFPAAAKPEELRERFESFLREHSKGKDVTKLRFVVERTAILSYTNQTD